jgi:hypothetical protein
MSARLALIRKQRALLRLRVEAQRLGLAGALRPWRRPLAIADGVIAVARSFRQNPLAIVTALVFLLATPQHRLGIWVGRLLTAWEIIHLLRHPTGPRPRR